MARHIASALPSPTLPSSSPITALKADLHLHSRHSDRAPEWLFRRVGLPDSYSDPRALYDALRARGMDFVTLTDHNRIDGCLEIADRPGVFLSEQISARFPEDRCEVHVLVWGITEAQHRELQALRGEYLRAAKVSRRARSSRTPSRIRSIASTTGSALAHIEKLVLLFQHFEGLNGLRDAAAQRRGAASSSARLTPAKIDELANRHGFAPTHAEPWRKVFIGGSDDHGGMFPGSRLHRDPAGRRTSREFLAHLRAGRCEPRGAGGTPLALSHSLYNNLRHFIGDEVAGAKSSSLVGKAFSRFMEGEDPTEFSWTEKLGFVAQGIASGKIFELAKPANASLWKQFADHFHRQRSQGAARPRNGGHRRARAARVRHRELLRQPARLPLLHDASSSSSPAGTSSRRSRRSACCCRSSRTLAPYLYAFRSQAPDRAWLAEVSRALTGALPPALRTASARGSPTRWRTSTASPPRSANSPPRRAPRAAISPSSPRARRSRSPASRSKTSRPIGEFELPEYELQKLSFPPILQIIDYIQREGFTELIITTPGPIGLTALLAAKILGIRTSGIYHTDFPQYVRILTDDTFLETLTWNFMKWFYEPARSALRELAKATGAPGSSAASPPSESASSRAASTPRSSIRRGATRIFGTNAASPRGHDGAALCRARLEGEGPRCDRGRLADSEARSRQRRRRPRLRRRRPVSRRNCANSLPDAIFTGYLAGLELARAFASADVFLFPSTTDTFGNVILEALASGVPCVVSDQGGPKDLIEHGVTGFITRARDAEDFTRKVQQLSDDSSLRQTMSSAARKAVQDRDWAEAGRQFWANGA